jgi:hypothetical protein
MCEKWGKLRSDPGLEETSQNGVALRDSMGSSIKLKVVSSTLVIESCIPDMYTIVVWTVMYLHFMPSIDHVL